MKNLKYQALGLIIVIISVITGCEQTPYEAIHESVRVINYTDGTIYIKYDSANFNMPKYHGYIDDIFLDSIPAGKDGDADITYKNYNLIMRDTTFSRIISGIQIFKIQDNDTIYINPEKYKYRTAWRSFHWTNLECSTCGWIVNKLEVNNSMF